MGVRRLVVAGVITLAVLAGIGLVGWRLLSGRGGTEGRESFLRSRQMLSENLEDDWKRLENGGYTARAPRKGIIDLQRRSIQIEFDSGLPQRIALPVLEARPRSAYPPSGRNPCSEETP